MMRMQTVLLRLGFEEKRANQTLMMKKMIRPTRIPKMTRNLRMTRVLKTIKNPKMTRVPKTIRNRRMIRIQRTIRILTLKTMTRVL